MPRRVFLLRTTLRPSIPVFTPISLSLRGSVLLKPSEPLLFATLIRRLLSYFAAACLPLLPLLLLPLFGLLSLLFSGKLSKLSAAASSLIPLWNFSFGSSPFFLLFSSLSESRSSDGGGEGRKANRFAARASKESEVLRLFVNSHSCRSVMSQKTRRRRKT